MRTSEWHRRFVIMVTLPLAFLISFVSLTGIYTDNFYANESNSWRIQCVGQDIINLVIIVPFLVISAVLTFLNRRAGLALWCGTLLYLIYTFVIYSFSVHYNGLFIAYTIVLGVCFYSFVYMIYEQAKERNPWRIKSTSLNSWISGYFVLIAVIFYGLWLKEIIGALFGKAIPSSLIEAGLFTNPVHVLDLAIMLPLMLIVSFLLYKNKSLGVLLTPVLLTFMILMYLTIAVLATMLSTDHESPGPISIILFTLAILSIFLIAVYFRKVVETA